MTVTKLEISFIHSSLTSLKYHKEISIYFAKNFADGKTKMSVLNAVRCKLLARGFAVINRNSPFVD
jgi:transposase